MATHNEVSIAGLRASIQQAITAYELAIVTSSKARQTVDETYNQHLADLAAQEEAVAAQRATKANSELAAGTAEIDRVGGIASMADELMHAATRLLDQASLAYVRGFSAEPVGTVQPHLSSDERTAAAFAAAHMANIDLHAALLKLATAHIVGQDWENARKILNPLLANLAGVFLEDAGSLLQQTFLQEADAEMVQANWNRARNLIEEARKAGVSDKSYKAWLRDIATRETKLLLDSGNAQDALTAARSWLGSHGNDPEFQSLMVQATSTLAAQALESNDLATAASLIRSAAERAGQHNPELQEWARRHPALIWRAGMAGKIRELSIPKGSGGTRGIAFTPDGNRIVSIGPGGAKIWDLGNVYSSRPERVTVGQSVLAGLTPDGLLVIDDDGGVCDTRTGEQDSAVPNFQVFLRYPAISDTGSMVAWEGPSERNLPLCDICVNDLRTGESISTIRYSSTVAAIALSGRSRLVAVLDSVGEVILTDIETSVARHSLKVRDIYGGGIEPCSMAFSPDGALLLATARRGRIEKRTDVVCWDTDTGDIEWSFEIDAIVGNVAFSADSSLIAIGAVDRVYLFDIIAKARLSDIHDESGGFGHRTNNDYYRYPHLAFSHDGSRLAVADSEHKIVTVWGLPQ